MISAALSDKIILRYRKRCLIGFYQFELTFICLQKLNRILNPMPQISLHPYQTPVYFIHNFKIQDKTSNDLRHTNRSSENTFKDSKISEKKSIDSNVFKATHHENSSKNKIRLISGKSVSKKLFEGAKVISNSKRQTFLSQPSKETEIHSMKEKQTKKIRFLRVPKSPIQKVLTPEKPQSVGVQKQVISEYYIQPEAHYSQLKEKNSKLRHLKENGQQVFNVDYQQGLLIKKKNMFTSSTGQLILKDLVGLDANPIQHKSKGTLQGEVNKKDSMKNFCLKLPKVISVEMHDGVIVQKIQPNEIGQTSFFDDLKDENKDKKYVSSFSKLIMKDQYEVIDSKELDLNQTVDKQSLCDLSIWSKN